jgi:hypothetical protein
MSPTTCPAHRSTDGFPVRLFEFGRLEELPIAITSGDGELVRARYIQYVDGPTCMERVGAQHDHFLTGERSIKLLFVFAEFLSNGLFRFRTRFRSPLFSSLRSHQSLAGCLPIWPGRDAMS